MNKDVFDKLLSKYFSGHNNFPNIFYYLNITKPLPNEMIPVINKNNLGKYSLEDFLDTFTKNYRVSLYGSSIDIKDSFIKNENKVYASSLARVAFFKSLVGNDFLNYCLENNSFIIKDFKEGMIKEKGLVYVIPDDRWFENVRAYESVSNKKVIPYIAKCEVLKTDLKNPVLH